LFNLARTLSNASPANPNLRGPRDISKIVPEIKEFWANHGKVDKNGKRLYPDHKIRLLGLINFRLKTSLDPKERDCIFHEPLVQSLYKGLLKMCLEFHSAFLKDCLVAMGIPDGANVMPKWNEIDKNLKLKHALIFEAHAESFGHNLHRCRESWGAISVLYMIHKSRGKGVRSSCFLSDSSEFLSGSGSGEARTSDGIDPLSNDEDYESASRLLSTMPAHVNLTAPVVDGFSILG
jgi:hypothetical protein